LYRGPELAEARRWWQQETPTQAWASRYGSRFDVAERFLLKSTRSRRLGLWLLFGNVALLVVAAVTVAALMAVSRNESRRAEAAALEARNAAEASRADREEAARLRTLAADAQQSGDIAKAEALRQKAVIADLEASKRQVLTPSEVAELSRLRKAEKEWTLEEADLRRQLGAQKPQSSAAAPPSSGADKAELDRLRAAESSWRQEKAQLDRDLAGANDRAAKSQQSESALKKSNDELQARLDAPAAGAPSTARPSGSSPPPSRPPVQPASAKPVQVVATDVNGRFSIFMAEGTYRVEFELPGFATAVAEGLAVTSTAGVRVDVEMRVGRLTKAIPVTGARRTGSRGQVQGRITDVTGAVLPGVTISFYRR
jgi:hypothetical protein